MFGRRTILVAALIALLTGQAFATAQIPEELQFDGRREMLFSEPLAEFLFKDNNLSKLEPQLSKNRCTGSWRNYRGSWEIRDARLYLTALVTDPCSDTPKSIPLHSLFTGQTGPVFAEWYTGTLVVPTGKRVQYIHMGYESQYEWYIVFNVVKGKVVARTETSTQPR